MYNKIVVIWEQAAWRPWWQTQSKPSHTLVQSYLPCGVNVHALGRATPLTVRNGSSIGSAVFAWKMLHSPFTLHCATPFPNIRIRALSNSWFLGLTQPTTPNGILMKLTVFHNKRSLPTDRSTNRRTERRRKSTGTNMLLTLYVRRGLIAVFTTVEYRAWLAGWLTVVIDGH